MPLTDKQQVFIDLYVIPGPDGSLNATQAYRRAYPNCKSDTAAQAASSRLLLNVMVREAVDKRLAEFAEETGLTAKRAWRESRYIAMSDIGDVIDFTGEEPRLKPANQIPESAAGRSRSVKVKRYLEGTGEEAREVQVLEFTFWDKPGELHTRLKSLGELKERIEVTGKDGGPIKSEHTVLDLPDISTEEFKALPMGERVARLKEVLRAINK